MGDMRNNAPTQAEINAQLLADNARLSASLQAIADQLARLEQRGQGNKQHFGRNHPYIDDPQSQSDEDSSDSEPPDRAGRQGAPAGRGAGREHRVQGDGSP
ncbi:hypothetical protein Bca4012_010411 [Brassica carinata]